MVAHRDHGAKKSTPGTNFFQPKDTALQIAEEVNNLEWDGGGAVDEVTLAD